MKIQSILTVAAALASGSAAAQTADQYQTIPAMPVPEITQNVISVATKYADSISCGDTQIQPNEIAALVPWTDDADRFDATYAVLWHNQIGCMGGSGSSATNISIVKVGVGNSFYVVPELSSPAVEFNPGTRFVERVVGNTEDSIVLEGLVHAEGDSNNFPSVKRKITVRADDNGNWSQD